MSGFTDDQADAILREAEERLAGKGSTKPAERPPKEPATLTSSAAVKPQEKLSVRQASAAKRVNKDTAGSKWFDLPKTEVTPEFKRDWQILRMRNILDPKQQRKNLKAEPPKYSQVGEIVAGPADYYSARLTRKERKRSLFQEALGDRDDSKLRTKYAGIQKTKSSGKKAFYQKLVSQRKRKG